MSADNDLECVSAPAPAATNEANVPTMMIDRAPSGSPKTMLVVGGLILVLVASVALAFYKFSPGGAATASAATVTVDEEASEDEAIAAKTEVPEECVGDITDPQTVWRCWYFKEFLPFAQKASADHDRLDRLEAEGKGTDVPLSLWLIVIGIGILTVINTLMILSKRTKPQAG